MWTSRFSICAWAPALAASAAARMNIFMLCLLRTGNLLLDFAPLQQRLRDGTRVDVLELAAQGHAARDAAGADAPRAQHLRYVVRRRLALVGEVGGEDHLLHL